MAKLGAAADANTPVVQNLNAASGQLTRFFRDLVPFSQASLPSLRSLGQASVTGKVAVQAARSTVKDLNRFAKPTPELAQNLAIAHKVLRYLNSPALSFPQQIESIRHAVMLVGTRLLSHWASLAMLESIEDKPRERKIA